MMRARYENYKKQDFLTQAELQFVFNTVEIQKKGRSISKEGGLLRGTTENFCSTILDSIRSLV